jgi:CheY-like chemotaxis protein
MMILVHDKYSERHKNFIKAILQVPGKHILVHVNNSKEALEALATYEFDLVTMDDLDGGIDIAEEIMSWPAKDRPRVVNIHSYAPTPAKTIAMVFKGELEVWMLQVLELKLVDALKEVGEKIAKANPEEEEEK